MMISAQSYFLYVAPTLILGLGLVGFVIFKATLGRTSQPTAPVRPDPAVARLPGGKIVSR